MTTKEHKQEQLSNLYKQYKQCLKCPLGRTDEHSFIFGTGNPDARFMIIGEAPGKNEDEQGIPFVGRSGQLLTKVLSAIGIDRSEIFITNIVKCRPQNNRTPSTKEVTAYKDFLLKQISIIQPTTICTLGSTATYALVTTTKKITELRGSTSHYNLSTIIPTYHPAYILRNISKISIFTQDIQRAFILSTTDEKNGSKQ
jgi:uracil-DNA glycosylase family 4